MKLIVNTSTLFSGGGVQVALSFIEECRHFPENEYHVFLCPALQNQVDKEKSGANFIFYDIERKNNPISNILNLRKKLSSLENKIRPDVVFTVFGPSYWTPKSPHLLGYAIPHYLYKDSSFFLLLSIKEKIFFFLRRNLLLSFFKKNSNYYHVETEDARLLLSSLLNTDKSKVFVVSNTYNLYFNNFKEHQNKILPIKEGAVEFRFLILSSYYKHKNIEILNKVIPELRANGIKNIEFITTLSEDIYNKIFEDGVKDSITNVGFIPSKDCPQLYSECDFVFVPTLLECFTANYPEAMKMKKPILTSNYSFATTVCENAALYFDPLDAKDICHKIELLTKDIELQKDLINKGQERVNSFPTAKERAFKYLEICETIKNK